MRKKIFFKPQQSLFILFTPFIFLLTLKLTHASSSQTMSTLPRAKPLVIAHRGGMGNGVENSLSLIRKNIASGFVDMMEVDIKLTKDGVPVIMHDHHVDRTTNGTGKIEEMTLAEVRKLVLTGSEVETVPTFQEVLNLCLENQMGLLIDSDSRSATQRALKIVQETLSMSNDEIWNEEKANQIYSQHRIAVIFWQEDDIEFAQKIAPGIPSTIIFDPHPNHPFDYSERIKNLARRFPDRNIVPGFNILDKTLNQRTIDQAREFQLKISVGWPNSVEEIAEVRKYDIDAICTDYPDRVF